MPQTSSARDSGSGKGTLVLENAATAADQISSGATDGTLARLIVTVILNYSVNVGTSDSNLSSTRTATAFPTGTVETRAAETENR